MLASTFRFTWRSLRSTPLVSAVAILSLALGIGANTALFSIFNGLLLTPLPVRDPGRLAVLTGGSWTYPIWEAVREQSGSVFDGTFAWSPQRFDLSSGGETAFVDGAYASGGLFDVLAVPASRGRMLTPADDIVGAPATAVISHRFWQQHFASAGDAVGRMLTLDRVPFTIVGVMPAGFFGPDVGRAADVMIPFGTEPLLRGGGSGLRERSWWWLEIMVRMKADQSIEQATAALRAAQPQIRAATLPGWSADMLARYLDEPFTLAPAATGRSELRGRFQTPLGAMIGAVALLLLVACANIANLLLARALGRRRELSVRLALGASRWQLARLLLAESVTISVAGALLGLVVAKWGAALLVQQFGTWRSTVFLELSLDWRVLTFTALLAGVTAMAAGVAPALSVNRVAPSDALREASRGIAGDRRVGVRGIFVVLQVALSLVLVVGAGLFVRTFSSLARTPLGFTPAPLTVVTVTLPPSPSNAAPDELRTARLGVVERLRTAAAEVPGVRSAGVSHLTPLSGSSWNNGVGDAGTPDPSRMTWLNAVTPGWFDTMGMRLVGGRDFTAADRLGGARVAVINETFARRFLPGQPPVGQTVRIAGTPYEIVGYIADAVYRSPREGMIPTMFVPFGQRSQIGTSFSLTVAIAGTSQRAVIRQALVTALRAADPSVAFTFRTFDEFVDAMIVQERLVAMLSAFFGGLALLLAGVGLYGVVSHGVNGRRAEIGLRLALGANRSGVMWLVFGRVGLLVGAGVAAGLVLSIWASRFVQAMLFQLDAQDPVTFSSAAVTLVLVAAAAAWIPARRAARLDPAIVLRDN
jgi:predicted permease